MMSDDQDECEWVNVSSGTSLRGQSWLLNGFVCVCVIVYVCVTTKQH